MTSPPRTPQFGLVLSGTLDQMAANRARWLRSADSGYRDDDGNVHSRDRVKDMIISGGENMCPAEVERVLIKHPAVAEVAVIGVAYPRWVAPPK